MILFILPLCVLWPFTQAHSLGDYCSGSTSAQEATAVISRAVGMDNLDLQITQEIKDDLKRLDKYPVLVLVCSVSQAK